MTKGHTSMHNLMMHLFLSPDLLSTRLFQLSFTQLSGVPLSSCPTAGGAHPGGSVGFNPLHGQAYLSYSFPENLGAVSLPFFHSLFSNTLLISVRIQSSPVLHALAITQECWQPKSQFRDGASSWRRVAVTITLSLVLRSSVKCIP